VPTRLFSLVFVGAAVIRRLENDVMKLIVYYLIFIIVGDLADYFIELGVERL
jgi:hypothetical protein